MDGRINYIPMNFGEASDYYRRFIDPVDLVCIKTALMDAHGYFNLGAAATYVRAVIERARCVIVETCEALARIPGEQATVRISEVDQAIDGGPGILNEIANPPITDIDRQVAEWILPELEDGACLQIGIGGMPNAVCASLTDSGYRDLGIHTEMFVDGIWWT